MDDNMEYPPVSKETEGQQGPRSRSVQAPCEKCASYFWSKKRQLQELSAGHKSRLKEDNQRGDHSQSHLQNGQSAMSRWPSLDRPPAALRLHLCSVQFSFMVSVIIYMLTLLPLVTGQSWLVEPQDTNVLFRENATIQCAVNDLGGRTTEWRQYRDDGNDTTLFLDDKRYEAPLRFSVMDNGNGFSLVLTVAQLADDADYQCGVQNFDQKRVRLTVLVEPGFPVIVLNDTDTDLQENQYVEFRCSSSGGNPPPTFKWYRDEIEVPASLDIPPPAKYGTSVSVLHRLLARNDHLTQYSCTVENQANTGNPKIVSQQLAVKYAPVIDLGQYQDDFKVILNDHVTLNCTVDSNPPTAPQNVTWTKDGKTLGSGFVLPFASVQKQDAGDYRCQASNSIGTGHGAIALNVLYGPEISIHFSDGQVQGNSVHIHEEEAINTTCVVSSNPPTSLNNIRFLKDGNIVKVGAILYHEAILRDKSGNYTCEASNTLWPSGGGGVPIKNEEPFQLHVLYAPGQASISIPELVLKGESATLTCTVDEAGDPAGHFLWTRLGESDVIWNGSSLTLSPVELSDHGDYVCTPHNVVGPGHNDIKLVEVKELPEWLGTVLPPQRVVAVNTTLEVACQIRGKPQPVIHWYRDGETIQDGAGLFTITKTHQPIDEHSWNVTSVLKWSGSDRLPNDNSLSYTDAGNYTCQGLNNLDIIQTDMELIIQYPPKVLASSEKVAIDRNQSASMACYSHSYPSTVFEWYNDSTKIVPGGRISITYDNVGGEYPHESTLKISNVSNVDLGDYLCRGCNLMGCGEDLIHLTVKDVPDRPVSPTISSKTWESANLVWTHGFDGGYPQMFEIHFQYYDNDTQGTEEEHVSVGDVNTYNVTDLFPAIQYTFTVYSRNNLGLSDPSESIHTVTNAFTVPMPGRVEYDSKKRILFFTSPSSNYCAHIEINSGNSWEVYEDCAPAEGSILIKQDWEVRDLRVALCLTRRQDVCSPYQFADFVGEDLPKDTIIIVGCVCGGVVVILTIVLIVLCCKRNQAKKQYDKQQDSSQMRPVISNNLSAPAAVTTAPSTEPPTPLKPAIKAGLDNPGLDQVDHPHNRPASVFTTELSGNKHRPGSPYNYDKPPNGHMNGQVPHGNSHQWLAPPSYDNQRNDDLYRRNLSHSPIHNNKLYLDDPYADHHKDPTNRSDSGMSTPDPQKPKKVIYEVIV